MVGSNNLLPVVLRQLNWIELDESALPVTSLGVPGLFPQEAAAVAVPATATMPKSQHCVKIRLQVVS